MPLPINRIRQDYDCVNNKIYYYIDVLLLSKYNIYMVDMAKESDFRKKGEKSVTISASVKPSLAERLDEYCEENEMYRSNVIEIAVDEYLKKKGKK